MKDMTYLLADMSTCFWYRWCTASPLKTVELQSLQEGGAQLVENVASYLICISFCQCLTAKPLG